MTRSLVERLAGLPGLRILGPAEPDRRVAVISVTVEEYVPEQWTSEIET